MKTEAEIRAHRDALKACLGIPCNCAGTEHEGDCREGGNMMRAVVRALGWALEENPGYQVAVDHLSCAAAAGKETT